jgi:hypothetical protein
MKKTTRQTIIMIMCLLCLKSYIAVATTITTVPICTYEIISQQNESPQYSSLMKCKVWQDDGKTQKIVSYKITEPMLTSLRNCIVTQAELNSASKEKLYAPPVNDKCQAFNSGLYISMVYVAEHLDKDKIFNQILRLIADLEKNGDYARARLAIPFYRLWFCKECNDFLSSIEKSDDIIVRSLNMNYSDSEAAELAIKIDDERWLLSLFRKNDEFSILAVFRTQ